MRSQGSFFPRLAIEQLEDRSLLAGVVNVELIDGVLWITGDNESNAIQVLIDQDEPGRVFVLPTLQNDPTTIRSGEHVGQRYDPVFFEGVTGGIRVAMHGGGDVVYMHYGRPSNHYPTGRVNHLPVASVSVDLGEGDDYFLLGHAMVSLVLLRSWPSSFGYEGHPLVITGDLHIATGAGDDYLALLAQIGGEQVLDVESDHLELFQSDHLTDEIRLALNVTPWLHAANRERPPTLPQVEISLEPPLAGGPPAPDCGTEGAGAMAPPVVAPAEDAVGPQPIEDLSGFDAESPGQLVGPVTADAYFLALATEDFFALQRRRG